MCWIRVSGPAGIVGGVNNQRSLSNLNTSTEVRPLSKAPNPQLLPGRRSIGCPLLRVCVHGVCVFTTVCVHLDGLNAEHKFRVWVAILGHTSLQSQTDCSPSPCWILFTPLFFGSEPQYVFIIKAAAVSPCC